MSIQNKPQMVEAVMFFSEHGGICKEMLFPEFEALLDGVVNLPDYADKQMRVVYTLINPRLMIRAAVFFLIDFDDNGQADTGWNIPLRHLAERAGRGPDLGAGPIRLACRSQCPVSWHQMHMWDPDLTPGHNDLVLLRDAAKRNNLGLLADEEPPKSLAPERLQMVSEDKWYAPDPAKDVADKLAARIDQEHRLKTAQLIKQQRLRIASVGQQHDEELAKFRLASEEKIKGLQREIHELHQALRQQEELNANLKEQLAAQADKSRLAREDMLRKLRALERHGRTEADILRAQFDGELQARIAAAVAEFKEQVAIRDVELAYRSEQESQLQEEIRRVTAERDGYAREGGEQILERLARLGLVFVVYHPGAGHLTIPLQDIARYQDNPLAYAASKCFVSEEQYRQWLQHYQKAACDAQLSSGEACGMPIDRIDTPSRFVQGESNCCTRHKTPSRLRTVG